MATYTQNYNLKKPGTSDNVNISDLNGNMDILDAIIYALPQIDDLYYKNGDTYSVSKSTQFAGICTGTTIAVSVPVPKSLENINSVTVSECKGIIYADGGRVDSHTSSSYNWLTNYTVTGEKCGEYFVKISLKTSDSFTNVTQYRPLTASLTLTLSFAT